MANPLLIAARIVPYRRAASRTPVGIADTLNHVVQGSTVLVTPLSNDLFVDASTYLDALTVVSGPVTAVLNNSTSISITGGNPGGTTTPYHVTYQARNAFGVSAPTSITGNVTPLVASVATLLARWRLEGNANDAVGTNHGQANMIDFGRPTLVTGGISSAQLDGVASYITAPNIASYRVSAYGLSVCGQARDIPPVSDNCQIINIAGGFLPGGIAIEHWNVSGISRLNGYIGNDSNPAAATYFAAQNAGLTNLPLNVGFMVAVTFDPGDDPKLRIYLRLAGGALNQVGSVTGTTFNAGLTQNTNPVLMGMWWGPVQGFRNPFDGCLQDCRLWSGTGPQILAALQALPAPLTITIPSPDQNPPNATNQILNLTSADTSRSLNLATAPNNTNAGGSSVTVSDVTGAQVTVTNTTPPQIVTVTRPGSGAGSYSATYTLTNPDLQTDSATLSGTIAAVGVVAPHPFYTYFRPPGGADPYDRPVFPGGNDPAPRNNSVIDPNSGLEVFAVLPPRNVELRRAGGAATGYYRPQYARHHLAETNCVWSAQGKYLWIQQVHGGFANSGQSWPGGGVFIRTTDWRIERVNMPFGSLCWWDDEDPNIIWNLNVTGTYTNQYRNYNVATNVVTNGPTVNGYRFFMEGRSGTDGDEWEATSYSRGMARGAQTRCVQRQTDGRRVIIKVNLRDTTGMHAGGLPGKWPYDIVYPAEMTSSGHLGPNGIRHGVNGGPSFQLTQSHRFCVVGGLESGTGVQCFNIPTTGNMSLDAAFQSQALDPDAGMRHISVGASNGDDIVIGIGTSNRITYHNVNDNTNRALCTYNNAGNPNTACCCAYDDTFNAYGAPAGSGVTAGASPEGPRYVIIGKSGNMDSGGAWAVRMGPNDTNVCRYLGHPMADYAGDDDNQADHNISPDGRFIVFQSNWLFGGNSNGDGTPYVIVLPPGWFSTQNSSI